MSEKAKNEAYWSEQNQEWEMSGLGQQKFCEQRGLSYRKFIYWRGLLRAGRKGDSKPKLLKVSTSRNELKQQPISQPDLGLEVPYLQELSGALKQSLISAKPVHLSIYWVVHDDIVYSGADLFI